VWSPDLCSVPQSATDADDLGMTTTELWRDRARWDALAQSHGLWIVAADATCIHVALHSGARTFALNRDGITASDVPGDAFEQAAWRLHEAIRSSPRRAYGGSCAPLPMA
jgi:hypothetical protein